MKQAFVIFLFVVSNFWLSAQITQEKADEMVLEYMSNETRSYAVYAKEDVQTEMTITTDSGESFELDYPCWAYYINYSLEKTDSNNTNRYLIVNESNGNLLEINTKNDVLPSGLGWWRIAWVESSNYSVWRCTQFDDVMIEWTFYPDVNLLHIKTDPHSLDPQHMMPSGDGYLPYCIIDDKIYPFAHPGSNISNNMTYWRISNLSETGMRLTCHRPYYTGPGIFIYDFICQTNQQEENNYPTEIPFTEYSLAESTCRWVFCPTNYNMAIIINSNYELENYIVCIDGSYSEIDFLKYTLLLTQGNSGSSIATLLNAKFLKSNTNEYALNLTISRGIIGLPLPWRFAFLVPKMPSDEDITLHITYN